MVTEIPMKHDALIEITSAVRGRGRGPPSAGLRWLVQCVLRVSRGLQLAAHCHSRPARAPAALPSSPHRPAADSRSPLGSGPAPRIQENWPQRGVTWNYRSGLVAAALVMSQLPKMADVDTSHRQCAVAIAHTGCSSLQAHQQTREQQQAEAGERVQQALPRRPLHGASTIPRKDCPT